MSETREARRERLLWAILPHVAFEGWTAGALRHGAADAGLSWQEGTLAFPDGVAEVVEFWSATADRQMLQRLQEAGSGGMRTRERVAFAVRSRIEVVAEHREAVRRTLSWLALPSNAPLAARLTYRTVDAIWYACGDTAADISFYSKRATLAAVYAATVLCWLDDDSDGAAETWAFLDRRIEDAMRIPKLRGWIERSLRGALRPLSARHGQ